MSENKKEPQLEEDEVVIKELNDIQKLLNVKTEIFDQAIDYLGVRQNISRMIDKGKLTINQAREIFGLAPIYGGDVVFKNKKSHNSQL